MESPVNQVLDAVRYADWEAVRLLLHPYLHWTDRDGVTVRGRRNVMAHLVTVSSVKAPREHELRDGQIYRSIEEPQGCREPATRRNTARMKLQATILISYRADSFGDAGDALDDVLRRAREREDVEIESIQLGTPTSAGPVSLPYVEKPPAPPQRVPHPLPDGETN